MSIDSKNPEDYLKKANEAFSNSKNYMDAELRNQWETNIRMYKNKHPSNSKYNTELYQKRSRIFRPKTRSSGIKFEAAAANAFFSTSDILDVTAENTKSNRDRASAALNKNLLQYRLTNTVPWYKICMAAAQEAWKMGVVVSKQYWKKTTDADGSEIETPYVELVAPESQYIDSSCDWLDPINSSPYIITIQPMYVEELKTKMRGADEDPTSSKWNKVKEESILNARTAATDSLRLARNGGTVDPKASSKPISDHDLIFVREVIMRENGKDLIYYTLDAQEMLSLPVAITEVYAHGRPYVMGSVLLEAFTVFKTGMPELGQPVQEEINYVANDRVDNVHLVLNKRYFAKRGRNIDFRSLLRNIPGSITVMDNPLEDVQVVPTNDITQSAYAEQDRLTQDYDELIGNFSAGNAQSQGLGGTVGGMGMASSGAGQITEYLLRNFSETWVEPVLSQLVKLEQKYETDSDLLEACSIDIEMPIPESTEGQPPVEPDTVDSILDSRLKITVNAGISSTNPHVRVERFIFAMTSVTNLLANPALKESGMNFGEVTNEIFGHLGYKDGKRFFSGENSVDPQVKELSQQVQQLTDIINGKKMESDARVQIEKPKIELAIEQLAFDKEKFKISQEKELAEIAETNARAQKLMQEARRLASGIDDQLALKKLQLEEYSILVTETSGKMKDKTARDGMLIDLKKAREELDGKLKITLSNRKNISNNIVDTVLPVKTKKTKGA